MSCHHRSCIPASRGVVLNGLAAFRRAHKYHNNDGAESTVHVDGNREMAVKPQRDLATFIYFGSGIHPQSLQPTAQQSEAFAQTSTKSPTRTRFGEEVNSVIKVFARPKAPSQRGCCPMICPIWAAPTWARRR